MNAVVDQDIVVLPHGDFCGVAALSGGAKEVIVHSDDISWQVCQLTDECAAWVAEDKALQPMSDSDRYYRLWRLLSKAQMWAVKCRANPAKRSSISVGLAREGDHLVACFTIHETEG